MGTPKNPDGFRAWTANRGDVPERAGEPGSARRSGCGTAGALALALGLLALQLARVLVSAS